MRKDAGSAIVVVLASADPALQLQSKASLAAQLDSSPPLWHHSGYRVESRPFLGPLCDDHLEILSHSRKSIPEIPKDIWTYQTEARLLC
jgi:hypothetical protein